MNNFIVIDLKTGFEMQPSTAVQTAAYEQLYNEMIKMKVPPVLSFEEDTHTYRLGDVKIPSITQVLKEAGLIDLSGIPLDRLEAARKFGTAVHLACELYDKDNLDEASLDPKLRSYLDAWIAFKNDMDFEFIAIEEKLVSITYRVAGTPDRIAKGDKRRRLAVLLTPEGKYKVTEYKDKADWQIFLAALSVFNWKERTK